MTLSIVDEDRIKRQAFRDVGDVLGKLILNHRDAEVYGTSFNRRMRWTMDAESGSLLLKFIQALIRGELGIKQ